jgi:hypothetical protein
MNRSVPVVVAVGAVLLSTSCSGGPVLPDVLEEILEGGYPVFADYLVCPFTDEGRVRCN